MTRAFIKPSSGVNISSLVCMQLNESYVLLSVGSSNSKRLHMSSTYLHVAVNAVKRLSKYCSFKAMYHAYAI